MIISRAGRVATLWDLTWDDDRLTCAIDASESGMKLTIWSNNAVIFTEPCDLQPRALARAQALRVALIRRGWREPGEG
jgi:hypothetical protein